MKGRYWILNTLAAMLLWAPFQYAEAQSNALVPDNHIYQSNIRTVQCYNLQKEQSLPVITLKSSERIHFSFDDLNGGSKNYWYTMEHCDSEWKSSRLSPLDYLSGLQEDRITDFKYAFGTLQQYTHYELSLPNDRIAPKISGNYLLKVYENGNPKELVITQRIYITDTQASIGIEILPSPQVDQRYSHQKINFTIFHSNPIQNPYLDLKALLMQNGDPLTARLNRKPSFVKPGALVYNDLSTNDFPAGNEFRKFDIRSLRYKAENVKNIIKKDSSVEVTLFPDLSSNRSRYSNRLDENGSFFIRNKEGRDDATESEYADVTFTLQATPPSGAGAAYVVGRFNDYRLNASSRMTYDPSAKQFRGLIKLKQGLYDYKYLWMNEETGPDESIFEGSFFETENTYQVFVYYKKPGSRWEELIGYSTTGSPRR